MSKKYVIPGYGEVSPEVYESYAADYPEHTQAAAEKPKRSKYRNERTRIDGIKFDSKKEANRYAELKLLEQAGEILFLTLQPKFPISGGDKPVSYVADFLYHERDCVVVEDVKGIDRATGKAQMTPHARDKIKLFKEQYTAYDFRIV